MATLYIYPGSQPSRAVLWFIAKNKIADIEVKKIDLGAREQLSPEFTAVSKGYQAVPVLKVGETAICESGAILEYLSTLNGNVDVPADPLQKALVQEAITKNDGLARHVTFGLIRPLLAKKANPEITKTQQKALIAEKAPVLKEALAFVDGILAKSKFIAGEAFTIADYIVGAELTQLVPLADLGLLPEGSTFADLPNITRYIDDLKQLEGYEQFTAVFGIIPTLVGKDE